MSKTSISSKNNTVKTSSNKNSKKSIQKKPKQKNSKSKVKKNRLEVLQQKILSTRKNYTLVVIIFLLAVLLIFSTYAWLSTALNVRIRNFSFSVTRNSGLTISLDGINFDSYVEISENVLMNELRETYPSNTSQWSALGLTPVSTNGLSSANNTVFDVYASGGVRYRHNRKENGFINTYLMSEENRTAYNFFIAFDVFLRNDSGSPISDNFYLDDTTEILLDTEDPEEEMYGLFNSLRVGFLRIGSTFIDDTAENIQGVTCNNDCVGIIYEPFSTTHSDLSIERALTYGIDLVNGEAFPTYASINAGGPIYVANAVSGSPNLDPNYFALQNTITEADFNTPLFQIPYGITKMRIYVWIEGQDIDSLETNSEGAEISLAIDFSKDTRGYTEG